MLIEKYPNPLINMIQPIDTHIETIRQKLTESKSIKAAILYGSWAKLCAREDSDVDLLMVVDNVNKKANRIRDELVKEEAFSVLVASEKDFVKEKLPVYTAAKREGKLIFGDIDMSLSFESPSSKYAGFFKDSRDFESRKVKLAQELLKDGFTNGVIDYCFVASKHALQASLAMKNEGYSSKIDVLLPLTEKYYGKDIASKFKYLYKLFQKSENWMDDEHEITRKEAEQAVEYAQEIMRVYSHV
ncbi:MAG: nucleotidyltransferase domain-containing protein [Pseudomonadota bacterium]